MMMIEIFWGNREQQISTFNIHVDEMRERREEWTVKKSEMESHRAPAHCNHRPPTFCFSAYTFISNMKLKSPTENVFYHPPSPGLFAKKFKATAEIVHCPRAAAERYTNFKFQKPECLHQIVDAAAAAVKRKNFFYGYGVIKLCVCFFFVHFSLSCRHLGWIRI